MNMQSVSLTLFVSGGIVRRQHHRQQQQRLDQARALAHQALAEAEKLLQQLARAQQEEHDVDGDSYDGYLDPPHWKGEQ